MDGIRSSGVQQMHSLFVLCDYLAGGQAAKSCLHTSNIQKAQWLFS